ncbi:MAG: sulfide/dihydroorotate dehydrogenase-like FAD/NAD-binding protein [Candidatus Omnitrophica bacterium]|nr:sulfide/dihydroorotate dehydrogenase-like FAD/NAD-binding protein [Candidatus Omnitrophota bacterium]MDD5236091.1 sulfide/dihydroorotate dehydrogenase-like FAD/NAD-binding protein [Candidatus Omnitrophota bacterium]MDD5610131.1 sulfide/dihydroorotate dehydrogenase-like FAD/NAD-binding protein [Candidatus Omnitrophota bacterium]
MFKILKKEELAKSVKRLEVEAPDIVKNASCGQFVVVIADEKGERIPLTLADWDKDKGTITLIFQEVGFSTKKLGSFNVGDNIAHILGPLGHPTQVKKAGEVICIGGGVGIAEVYPVARAFKKAGNKVVGIIGARSKDILILEKEMKETCDELEITTDDGSYGRKGFVTDILKERLKDKPALVYAIGPVAMMKAVSEATRGPAIKTVVSLNPILVDATGMCGSCRCRVAGKTVFGCVDGPDFDGHEVDFEELQKRLNLFTQQEKQAMGLNK